MKNNDSSSPAESSVTNAASGSMTGTITYLHNSQVIEFNSNTVSRFMVGPNTQIYAAMSLPGPDRAYRIYLTFPGSEPVSGTYNVGSANLSVFVDIVDHAHLAAESGQIVLRNHTPIRRLTGSANFKTQSLDNMQYEITVEFDITDTVASS